MKKNILYFYWLIIFLIPSAQLFAEESITITTYYPSPYGSYNELQSNKLAVGDTNGNGTLDAADQPNRNGDIRLKAQTGNPTSWPAGTTGQIAYSSSQDALYHYNGATWVASGGGAPGTWTCQIVSGAAGNASTATCPTGTTLITGGCGDTPAFFSNGVSRPADNGWYCYNPIPGGSSGRAFAWCCQ